MDGGATGDGSAFSVAAGEGLTTTSTGEAMVTSLAEDAIINADVSRR